ncbi:hypothetical protein LJC56_11575 [Christensenellaceae bacterium OttesenSCG-928-K19]|nr:hypothetical protein [Christensenellaceae bacterium OttesenSCG-928-K19]
MEKQGHKKRDIRFFSNKNDCMMTVHSKEAKKYADNLEEDEKVKGYQTNVPLVNFRDKISLIDIRKSYQQSEWTSDFMLIMPDDSVAIREVFTYDDLKQRAPIERMELSRRYWKAAHVTDWGIVLVKKEERAW